MNPKTQPYRRNAKRVKAEYRRKAREAEVAAGRTHESAAEQIYLEIARKFRALAAERRSA
jgi:hypothetical protein